MICRRCGFENEGGDQFCGSCGAFLEWDGEPAGGAEPVTPAPAPGVGDESPTEVVPPAAAVAPAGEWPPVASSAPATAATPVPATEPAAAGLVRCPACGIANAANRTFCQSCGTRLADASRVAEVSKEQIAAAVAATPRPKAVPVAGVTTTRTEPTTGRSRGIPGWLVAVVALGVLFGVGFVAAGQVLRSPGPSTGAEATPAAASAGPAASDGGSAEPGAAGASSEPTAEPSNAPLLLVGASASSVVGDLAKFQPAKAIDGDPKTCWQEGSAKERGQWIEVTFAPSRVVAVDIANGYGASNGLHKGNHRPKVVRISVDGGEPLEVTLKDRVKVQRVKLGEIEGATTLRITIVSVYAARKTSVAGTPFDDAAISEITVIGVPEG